MSYELPMKEIIRILTNAQKQSLLSMTDEWQRPSRKSFNRKSIDRLLNEDSPENIYGMPWLVERRNEFSRTPEYRLTEDGVRIRDYLSES